MTEEQFSQHYNSLQEEFNSFTRQISQEWNSGFLAEIQTLLKSMTYSLENGGKRFRPVLALMIGDLFSTPREKVLPYALAVECIHTYSLIHDDLPCMDNDDERRGQPTNHKVFGEDIALIAGDALLTVAFELIALFYQDSPSTALQLVKTLSRAAGYAGMVGGQAVDLKAQKDGVSRENLQYMHELKTGALIYSAAKGAAIASQCTVEQAEKIGEFGKLLGLAFQVADDLLDFNPKSPELGNFATVIGFEQTQQMLEEVTIEAAGKLSAWGKEADPLRGIIQFNLRRKV